MANSRYIEPQGANGYRFAWYCSAFNCTYYDYTAPDGARGKLTLRHRLGDYEASIYNGGPAAYERECGPLVMVLRHETSVDRPVSAQLLEAFNAWLRAKHEAFCAQLASDPERYGADALETVPPLEQARDAAHYAPGLRMWRFNSVEARSNAALRAFLAEEWRRSARA